MDKSIEISKIENKVLKVGLELYRAKGIARILYSLCQGTFGVTERDDLIPLSYLLYKHIDYISNISEEIEKILRI